jgi:soluble lytic murein transglycosylase-like protein
MKTSATFRSARQLAVLSVFAVVLLTRWASAAEVAVLRNGYSIRHEHRAVVGEKTRLYLDRGTTSFIDVLTADIEGFEQDVTPPPAVEPARAPAPTPPTTPPAPPVTDLNTVVNRASATFHLDPDLVNSVIHAESGFNSHAVSRKGAQGLMQLMPETASKLGVSNAFDPQANVTGGSRYLRELLERYNFDLIKALAAYNAGTKPVERYKGVPPYQETQAYVRRIVQEFNRKKIAQEKEEKRAQQAAAASEKAKSSQKVASPGSQPPPR